MGVPRPTETTGVTVITEIVYHSHGTGITRESFYERVKIVILTRPLKGLEIQDQEKWINNVEVK